MKINKTFAVIQNSLPMILLLSLAWCISVPAANAQETDVQKLIQDLNHEDNRIRRDAAMYLSELAGDSVEVVEAVPALIKALGDSQDQVWFHSVTALARLGPDAAPAIPELINDLREMRRTSVNAKWYRSAYALGQIGEAAVQPLIKACENQRSSVRAGAAKAMEWIPEAAAETAPVLISLLEDRDQDVREIASESLSALPEPALQLLVKNIHHESESTREAVYTALGRAGARAQDTAPNLLKQVQSEGNNHLLAVGVDALAKIGAHPESFFAFLKSRFPHEDPEIQQSIANAILSLPSQQSVPMLIQFLDSKNPQLQSRAADLLGHIGPDAAPALENILNLIEQHSTESDHAQVFKDAYVAIGLKGIPVLLNHIEKLDSYSSEHWTADLLSKYGMIGVANLEESLDQNNTQQILAVMDAFAKMGSAAIEAEESIVRMTRHESPNIRSAAVQALTSVGIKPSKLSPLVEPLLNDQSLQVRQSAVSSLRKSPEAAADQLDKLDDLLSDPDPGMRESALLAIASTGNQADDLSEAVAMLLADPESEVRLAAIQTLGSIGKAPNLAIRQMDWLARNGGQDVLLNVLKALGRMGESAAPYLSLFEANLQNSNDDIRQAAFAGYIIVEENKESLLPVMIKAVEDESTMIRHSSLKAMGSMREDAAAAIPNLIARLDYAEDQDLALGALRFMPSKIEFIGDYIESLEHEDPGVRHFGCRALGRLGKDAASALPKLKEARRDRYRFVRDEANKAIQRIQD